MTDPGSESGRCDARMQAECEADPDYMAVVGTQEEFEGCTPGKQFLGCIASTTVPSRAIRAFHLLDT